MQRETIPHVQQEVGVMPVPVYSGKAGIPKASETVTLGSLIRRIWFTIDASVRIPVTEANKLNRLSSI